MKFRIIHNPLGLENPYTPGADERTPRYPIQGEPVKINYRILPADAEIKTTRVIVSTENGDFEYQGVEQDSAGSWSAFIPPMKEKSFEYRIFLASKEGEEHTGRWFCGYSNRVKTEKLESFEIENDSVCFFLRLPDSLVVRKFRFFGNRFEHKLEWKSFQNIETADSLAVELESDTGSELVFKAANWTLSFERHSLTARVEFSGKRVYQDSTAVEFHQDRSGETIAVRAIRETINDEGFYGFGERFNSLNQRGNKLDVRVYEEYKKQDEGARTYIPVPFFITDKDRGHWANTARKVSYDLDSAGCGQWSMEAETGFQVFESLDDENKTAVTAHDFTEYFFIGEPVEVLNQFQALTSFPVMPPDWVFTPWMSGNEWNNQKRVMDVWEKTRELDIPAGVLVIEAWSDEKNFYIWNDAEYEPKEGSEFFRLEDFTFPEKGLWPDPKGMIDKLHEGGTKVVLWQIPLLKALNEDESPSKQRDNDQEYMIENDYCVKHADGSPYTVRPWWFPRSHAPDFTNREALSWWINKRRYLVDQLNIDGFKTDGGEHLWGHSLRFSDGRFGDELWNEYPVLYEKAYYDLINQDGQGCVFSRSGFTGAGANPIHWSGDQDSTWEAHRSVINAVLTAGISGIPFMGWDIGGFSGELPTAELYLRSTAMACFSPLMQYHSELNNYKKPIRDRTPWNIAEQRNSPEVISIYRFFAKIRMLLQDYLVSEARHTCESGIPMMRPLFMDYPGDRLSWECDDQYLFGRDLLVAPILFEGQHEREIYLPSGRWHSLWSGDVVEGGAEITVDVPLYRIPVYIREGSPVSRLTFPQYGV